MIDSLNDNRVRAVLYGHEHIVSTFLRKGVLYAVAAPSGGGPQSDFKYGELHGPVDFVHGGEFHLDSYQYDHYLAHLELDDANSMVLFNVLKLPDYSTVHQYKIPYK